MKVAIYHRSIANSKSQEKVDFFINFSQGVKVVGDQCVDHYAHNVISSDVGVILGWVHEDTTSPHLKLRKGVIEQQRNMGGHVVCADSNLFLYANPTNPHHYLRYSFDGVFPNTGNYCDSTVDSLRWQKLSRTCGIAIKDYRTRGDHLLICLQRNGGWSMGQTNVVQWAVDTVNRVRQVSDRPVVIRPHPGDKKVATYIVEITKKLQHLKNVKISDGTVPLIQDLRGCWAVVNHNSSPAVAAAIEGFPVFVTDPERSQARQIANTDFAYIERPVLFDRQSWAERLAMSHWNFQELASGECWTHMRKFV